MDDTQFPVPPVHVLSSGTTEDPVSDNQQQFTTFNPFILHTSSKTHHNPLKRQARGGEVRKLACGQPWTVFKPTDELEFENNIHTCATKKAFSRESPIIVTVLTSQ